MKLTSLSLVALAASLIPSCLEPTQITVAISTNYDCVARRTETGVLVGDKGVTTATTLTGTKSCKSDKEVGKMVIVPRESTGREPVYVRVVAGIDGTSAETCADKTARGANEQCIEVNRIVRFVHRTALTVPIELDSLCINKQCPDGYTCERGECKSADFCGDGACEDAGVVPPIERDAGPDGPTQPPLLAKHIFGGFGNMCATMSDDSLWCWGDNANRQIDLNGAATGPREIALPNGHGPIQHVAIGAAHICASDAKRVYCWGDNKAYQRGQVTMSPMSSHDLVVSDLAAGEQFTCALKGSLVCWGTFPELNLYGVAPKMPQTTSNLPPLLKIAAGDRHLCVSSQDQTYCAGYNKHAQVGLDPVNNVCPNYVCSSFQMIQKHADPGGWLFAGGHHTGAWAAKPFVWGQNLANELTDEKVSWTLPTLLITQTIPEPVKVAFGSSHTCALSGQGKVACRGGGTLWRGSDNLTPLITDIAANATSTCVVTDAGEVRCAEQDGTLAPVKLGR